MPSHYLALVVVFAAAAAVLTFGKRLFTRFMSVEDFRLRRNLWLALTAAAFLAPSFWLYALVAAPLMLYGAKKDSNPVALYLFLLLAVPPLRVDIPTLGLVRQLFPMDHLRLLSLALLVPVALRLRNSAGAGVPPIEGASVARGALTVADVLLLSYLGLQFVVMLPYDSMTNAGRRITLALLDVVLPYFVISRACRTREMIIESMAGFVMAVMILTPLAVYEFFKGWMLFAGIQYQWEAGRMYFPLHRGNFLRALTTAGHSINLGYFMAVALGMWVYLQRWAPSTTWRWLGFAMLLGGLVAPLARGPWIGALLILFTYLSLGPNAASRVGKGLLLTSAAFAVALVSPLGDRIIDHLPFVGTVDAQTIHMRQQLAAGSWLLIQQNPFFGSPYFMSYMEEFRTGEGIIDLVNTYAAIALGYGLVGAALFIGVFLALMVRAYRVVRQTSEYNQQDSLLGSAIIACILGTLVVIATTSFQLALPAVAWSLAALAWAYSRLPAQAPAAADSFRPALTY